MGILSGAMTVRRFRVEGEIPEGFRDLYRDRLQEYAFIEPPQGQGKEEVEGWVQVHNLLENDFSDFNQWFYDPYAVFALRVDKKTLPARLFKATLQKRCKEWCEDKGVERCPASVKNDLKETLEAEWLSRALPRVAVTEACWHVGDGYLVLHSLSEKIADRFRKRFHQTFGLQLVPWAPLDWVGDADKAEQMLSLGPSPMLEEAS